MSAAKIFLTGATGYIGGSVLTTLLKYPHKYEVTALVRNKDQAEILKKLGVQTVIGDLDNLDLLTKCAKAADAVIQAANIYDLPPTQALVKGLKAKNDKRAVYLHTSGTDVLCFAKDALKVPYDDEDTPRFRTIPDNAIHKDVDSWVLDNSKDITAAIIFGSTVHGIGSGPCRKTSSQIPALVKAAAARRQAGWVGPRNDVIWGNVNINDLVELYRLVLDGLLDNTIGHGKDNGLYFASVHEHTWGKVAEAIANILHKLGLVKTLEVTQFEKEYVDKYLWGEFLEEIWLGDSRAVANRCKKIGWKPIHPTPFETLDQEIKYLIQHGDLKN